MVKSLTVARRKRHAPLAGVDRVTTMGCWRCSAYTPYVLRRCQYDNCTEIYCGRCRRAVTADGPAGCPCDSTRHGSCGYGHRTKDEQPRRAVRVKR